jgi:kinetochore protein Nuf2
MMSRNHSAPPPQGPPGGGGGGGAHAFPRLGIDEMMEDMALFRQPITREHIRAPTPESVRNIFGFFIEMVYKKSDDDLRQPSFGCLDPLDYPELLDEAIPFIHFLRACQKIFRAAQYNYFRMRDLTHPTPARFHIQLSALINFARFREGRVQIFESMSAEARELRDKRAILTGDSDEIDARIAEIDRLRAEEEPAVAVQQEIVSESTAELAALHAQQNQLADDTKEMKALLQATVEKISSLKFSHLAASQELDNLRASVVSSPDRVKAEIAEAANRVEEEKENVQAIQRHSHDLQIRADAMGKASLDVAFTFKLVEDALVDMEKVKVMEQRVRDLRAKIRDFDAERESIETSSTHIERQIKSIEQRLIRVRQQREELSDQARLVDGRLTEQEREAEREVEAAERLIAENKRRAGDISRQMQKTVHDFEVDISNIAKKLGVVDKNLKDLYSGVSQASEFVAADNKNALMELQRVIDESNRKTNSI